MTASRDGNDAAADPVRAWIAASQRVVALTGAGISTDSGIPDFRGSATACGRATRQRRSMSDIRYYMADPEVRKASWQSRLAHPGLDRRAECRPPRARALERRGKLHALITQNIDGLHQQAGNSRRARSSKCTATCIRRYVSRALTERPDAAGARPRARRRGGPAVRTAAASSRATRSRSASRSCPK